MSCLAEDRVSGVYQHVQLVSIDPLSLAVDCTCFLLYSLKSQRKMPICLALVSNLLNRGENCGLHLYKI